MTRARDLASQSSIVSTAPIFVSPEERWTISATSANTTVNFDADTQGVLYYTSNVRVY